jgi:steroid delta-isomerase-like uncharacterized protein
MSAEANAATARRIVEEAWNQGNLGVIDECCKQDVVDHDLAMHEDLSGAEAGKERVQQYRDAMPDLHVEIQDLVAQDDEVVTRWTAAGTNDGELMGMSPTHKRVTITGMSIDRFDADGRLVESWDQWDYMGFMQQLGMTQEGAQA